MNAVEIKKLIDDVKGLNGKNNQQIAEVVITRWFKSINNKNNIIRDLEEEIRKLTEQLKDKKPAAGCDLTTKWIR